MGIEHLRPFWTDPDTRAKASARLRAQNEDPEFQARAHAASRRAQKRILADHLAAHPDRAALVTYLESHMIAHGVPPNYLETAERFKVTKNVVAGQVNRLRRSDINVARKAPPRSEAAARATPPAVIKETNGCRYIAGDTREDWTYCGAPLSGRVIGRGDWSPYCSHHHDRCYSGRVIRGVRS